MTVLPPTNPDKLEQLVSEHLQKTLDSQRGRAVAAFRDQVKNGGPAPLSFDTERRKYMRRLKIWAAAASAMAASLALMITIQHVNLNGGDSGQSDGNGVAQNNVPM